MHIKKQDCYVLTERKIGGLVTKVLAGGHGVLSGKLFNGSDRTKAMRKLIVLYASPLAAKTTAT